MAILKRRAARIIVLDPQDRIFLFQFARANGERFWATPGGGVERDESFLQAAHRELMEELRLTVPNLSFLWNRSTTFPWNDGLVEQEEQFFVARLDVPFSIDSKLAETHKKENILGYRWWSIDELSATKDLVFPEDLGSSVSKLKGF